MSFTDPHTPVRPGSVSNNLSDVSGTDPTCFKQPISGQAGRSFPLGATVLTEGVNFSVFSRQATRVDLLLFDDAAPTHPARVIELDARTHRIYHYWHVFVSGIGPGQVYAFRTSGPFVPEHGLRFDPDKVLLDPYGRAVVVPEAYSRPLASRRGDNTTTAMKSVVVDPSQYDWWKVMLHYGGPLLRQ